MVKRQGLLSSPHTQDATHRPCATQNKTEEGEKYAHLSLLTTHFLLPLKGLGAIKSKKSGFRPKQRRFPDEKSSGISAGV